MPSALRLARLSAIALAGLLGACSAGGPPATRGLNVETTKPAGTPTIQSPASSPSEEPDDDSPDEEEPSQSPGVPTSPPQPPTSGQGESITGTWDGLWQNDPQWGDAAGGFTIAVVQHGASFDGTIEVSGPTCVRHGTVSGTVTGAQISMGVVAATVRDVNYEGTLSGNSMSGTWTGIACGVDYQISGAWSAQKQ